MADLRHAKTLILFIIPGRLYDTYRLLKNDGLRNMNSKYDVYLGFYWL